MEDHANVCPPTMCSPINSLRRDFCIRDSHFHNPHLHRHHHLTSEKHQSSFTRPILNFLRLDRSLPIDPPTLASPRFSERTLHHSPHSRQTISDNRRRHSTSSFPDARRSSRRYPPSDSRIESRKSRFYPSRRGKKVTSGRYANPSVDYEIISLV